MVVNIFHKFYIRYMPKIFFDNVCYMMSLSHVLLKSIRYIFASDFLNYVNHTHGRTTKLF